MSVLEQEGQVTHPQASSRQFVTELRIEGLKEIYQLRQLLKERAARRALPTLDKDVLRRTGPPPPTAWSPATWPLSSSDLGRPSDDLRFGG